MKAESTSSLKKGDVFLIIGISILSFFGIFYKNCNFDNKSDKRVAVVTHNGQLIKRLNLDNINRPIYLRIKNEGVLIVAEMNRIRFMSSNCHNKTCIKAGWLTKIGDNAICVPTKTKIVILNTRERIDSLSY